MTKQIFVGSIPLGGGAPLAIQSMCNTDTRNAAATLEQVTALEKEGCHIVRLAVPDDTAAAALGELVRGTRLPLVADIHFDYRLALAAMEAGVSKVRINPGNIGSAEKVRLVADCARDKGIPIRVGVNSGSVNAQIRRSQGITPETLCQAALENIQELERWGFEDICISLKAPDVFTTIRAYRRMAALRPYPLHLGVTEAGTQYMGTLKSAAAFGALLADGIGDTLRVSLTEDPVLEVIAAKDILRALGLNGQGVTIISCPTCGRTQVDLIPLAKEVERRTRNIRAKLTVAVMGCAVNGPGEAEGADVGIACGRGEGLVFRKGEILYKVPESKLVDSLLREIESITGERIP